MIQIVQDMADNPLKSSAHEMARMPSMCREVTYNGNNMFQQASLLKQKQLTNTQDETCRPILLD
jgi:hypothetical protein